MTRIIIPAERLVAGARCLLPLVPPPSDDQIDDVLARLARAFDVPFTVESDARMLWRSHVAPFRRTGLALELKRRRRHLVEVGQ